MARELLRRGGRTETPRPSFDAHRAALRLHALPEAGHGNDWRRLIVLLLTLALALLIGISLGVLGGGGSILTVPILVYVLGMPPKEAIATSLFVVGVTSAAGAISHARAGRVRWRTGLMFGVAGMTGAYAGGRIAAFIPGSLLLVAFALMMFVTAAAMLRKRSSSPDDSARPGELKPGLAIVEGLAVGLVTGMVGAGGGFLVVPALALLGGLPMEVAIGTSLLIIAMKSGAGLVGYLHSVNIDWTVASLVAGIAVVGSFIGGRLVGYMSEDVLRRAFGWFVVAMAVLMLGKQAPPELLTSPYAVAGAALLLVVGLGLAARRLLARQRSEANEADEAVEAVEAVEATR